MYVFQDVMKVICFPIFFWHWHGLHELWPFGLKGPLDLSKNIIIIFSIILTKAYAKKGRGLVEFS